jgi:tetratricopeptide (TPR) repeat protein/O-antigen ligase
VDTHIKDLTGSTISPVNILRLLALTLILICTAFRISAHESTHLFEIYLVIEILVFLATYDFISNEKPGRRIVPELNKLLETAIALMIIFDTCQTLILKDFTPSVFTTVLFLMLSGLILYLSLFGKWSSSQIFIGIFMFIQSPLLQPRNMTTYGLDFLIVLYAFLSLNGSISTDDPDSADIQGAHEATRDKLEPKINFIGHSLGDLALKPLFLFPLFLVLMSFGSYPALFSLEFASRVLSSIFLYITVQYLVKARHNVTAIITGAILLPWFVNTIRTVYDFLYRINLFGLWETLNTRIMVANIPIISFAPYIACLTIYLTILWINCEKKRKLISAIVSFSLITAHIVVLISGVRSAIIGLILGWALFFFKKHRSIPENRISNNSGKIIVLSVLAIAVLGMVGYSFLWKMDGGASLQSRLIVFKSSVSRIVKSPFAGTGPFTRQFHIKDITETSTDPYSAGKEFLQGMTVHPHNLILHLAEDTGLIGLLLFALFLAIPIIRSQDKGSEKICALAVLIPYCAVDSPLVTKGYSALFMFLTALCVHPEQFKPPAESPSAKSKYLNIPFNILLMGLVIFLSIFQIKYLIAEYFINLSGISASKGNLLKARVDLSMAAVLMPEDPSLCNSLGDLCLDLKDYIGANTNFQESLEIISGQYYPTMRIGDIHFINGRFTDALKSYEEAENLTIHMRSSPLLCSFLTSLQIGMANQDKFLEFLKYQPDGIIDENIANRQFMENICEQIKYLITKSETSNFPGRDNLVLALIKFRGANGIPLTDIFSGNMQIFEKLRPGRARVEAIYSIGGIKALQDYYLTKKNLTSSELNHLAEKYLSENLFSEALQILDWAIDINNDRLFDGFNYSAYLMTARILEKRSMDTDQLLNALQRVLFFIRNPEYLKKTAELLEKNNCFKESREAYLEALEKLYEQTSFRLSRMNIPLFIKNRSTFLDAHLRKCEKANAMIEKLSMKLTDINSKLGIDQ